MTYSPLPGCCRMTGRLYLKKSDNSIEYDHQINRVLKKRDIRSDCPATIGGVGAKRSGSYRKWIMSMFIDFALYEVYQLLDI